VFDSQKRFVIARLDTEADGTELLTAPAELSRFGRDDLGAPHPALEQILTRLKLWVTHPEWMKQMRVRQRGSYLFVGPTGTGKTTHLKVLARELTDFIEGLTGERVSRLVVCDASSFFSPWFGETEAKITAWIEKIGRLGRLRLTTRDGREIPVPLVVVIEEAEGLFRSRSESASSSHLFDRPLALLLQKLDALTDTLDVPLVFCSTRLPGAVWEFVRPRSDR
jgi:SpoVK/Ycf46/Vps4 family AAA+-type ATPase